MNAEGVLMFNQTEKSIAQIAEYIPRARRDMKLKEAKARLATKIALYITDGSDAEVLNATFARALNSHTREAFFSNVSASIDYKDPSLQSK
uniref:Uncharacterized protein n=2 Tax=Klebsiella pneumoniae TaxID=573 RepID=A0A411AK17_KLEPN|nr:hypothetical protein [Klebsiella pneumoniae]